MRLSPWGKDVQFSHWHEPDGPIESIPLYVYRRCTKEEAYEWEKSIRPRNVLRVKIRFTKDQYPDQRRAHLVEFIGKERSAPELKAAAKDRRPATLDDKFFQTLTLDRQRSCYDTTRKWKSRNVDIKIYEDDTKKLQSLLRKVEKLWTNETKLDQHVRDVAANDLLSVKNSNWLNDGEKPLSRKKFQSQLKLIGIAFSSDSTYEFAFDAGDMFFGHDVIVHGKITGGPHRAELIG